MNFAEFVRAGFPLMERTQAIGLLWQKLWNREHKAKPPQAETPEQTKQRQKIARKAARQTPLDQK
ncbi:hypothetical protein [Chamaesiphon sp.]|uniref:hypothetical protein n=1 Tax=Chamaesiphon sp. TaxID=2814140 RepID=UPI0035947F3E